MACRTLGVKTLFEPMLICCPLYIPGTILNQNTMIFIQENEFKIVVFNSICDTIFTNIGQ